MAEEKTDCLIHLTDSIFNATDLEDWAKEADLPGVMDDKSLAIRKLEQALREKAESHIDRLSQELHDRFVVRESKDKIIHSKNIREAYRKRAKFLTGRAGLDTKRRMYAERLKAKRNQYRRMFGVPDELNLQRFKKGSDLEREWHKATEKVDIRSKVPDITKLSPLQAKALAKDKTPMERLALAHAAYNEYGRRFLNNHGLAVKYHKQYVIKKRYDAHRIKSEFGKGKEGRQAFAEFVFEHMDLNKSWDRPEYRTKEYTIKYLLKLYDTIQEKEYLRASPFYTTHNKTSPDSLSRKFVWKDADSSYEIFNKMSAQNVYEQVSQLDWGMATTAVKVKYFGYDHKKVAETLDKQLSNLARFRGKADEVLSAYQAQRLKQIEASFTGDNAYASTGWSVGGNALKSFFAVRLLGNVIKVAMLDKLDVGRQSFHVSGRSLGAMLDWQSNFFKTFAFTKEGRKKKMELMKEVAEHLAIEMQYGTLESSMRVSRGDLASSAATKWMENTNRATGWLMKVSTLLPQQTSKSRLASGVVGANIFTKLVDKINFNAKGEFVNINKFERDTLKEYKFSAREIGILKEAKRLDTWTGKTIISSHMVIDHILQADPTVMANKLGILVEEVGPAAFALADKYDMFINDFFTRGTPTPELWVKSALLKGSDNEIMNMFISLLTQFKDTPMMQLMSYMELIEKLKRLEGVEGKSLLGKEGHKVFMAIGKDAFAQAVPHALAGFAAYLFWDSIWSFANGHDSLLTKWEHGDDTTRNTILLDVLGRISLVPFAAESLNGATSMYRGKGLASTMLSSPIVGFASDMEKAFNPNQPETIEAFFKKMIPNAAWAQQFTNEKSLTRRAIDD